ncbi:tripartite tricarboxylate transporter substrate binding protein [Pseudorhodoplanes sp.]|uniref:Bug family tripartite tricarboxylate transporter substrate binding protein n=1 Tax=Pseudorhodoplanes sp. TaxID=1934341 RepID=UPI002B5E2D4A|nr:tripartite tricarboxylate transporter substrate binding protein [Pseudorhodoplanes sp.]HWV40203.1 tripartite tricarboxylate transporter substrate binding protein [Pseudorhodoplanes sp.]
MRLTAFAALAAALAISTGAAAQDKYPSRPITLSHGFGAGGNSDTVARIIAPVLAERLGQQVVVEPRVGAGGNLATDRVAKAAPDGYNLIVLTGGHAVSGALYKALPFHPVDDLQMLSTLIYFPFVISVRKDHRFQSLADLVAEAKAKPKTITYSSVGVGSTQHLAGELLASLAGIELVHVPYRGGQAPVTDLLGGRIDVMIDTLTVTRPQLQAGTIRGLAVTSPAAWPSLPGISPASQTVKDYDVRSWMGIATTKGVPEPIVRQLNAEILYALKQPQVRDKLEGIGNEVRGSTPDEMRNWIAGEIAKWRKVIDDAKVERQ